jgi:hypothetical protein
MMPRYAGSMRSWSGKLDRFGRSVKDCVDGIAV